MDHNESELLTMKEAADLMGRSVRTLRRWCAAGEFTSYRVKNRLYVKRADLLAMVKPAYPAKGEP